MANPHWQCKTKRCCCTLWQLTNFLCCLTECARAATNNVSYEMLKDVFAQAGKQCRKTPRPKIAMTNCISPLVCTFSFQNNQHLIPHTPHVYHTPLHKVARPPSRTSTFHHPRHQESRTDAHATKQCKTRQRAIRTIMLLSLNSHSWHTMNVPHTHCTSSWPPCTCVPSNM